MAERLTADFEKWPKIRANPARKTPAAALADKITFFAKRPDELLTNRALLCTIMIGPVL